MINNLVIVGGVAGGASAAARARRLSDKTKITIIEKGGYVSFANCGLPYHIGGEIKERAKLLVHTPQSLKERFGLEVLLETKAVSIDRSRKVVETVNNLGERAKVAYDKVIIATGAAPIRPNIAGVEGQGVFTLRDIADMDRIIEWLNENRVKKAIVVGGGYIGVEMAEQLVHRQIEVTLIEGKEQVLAPLDPEMASIISSELASRMEVRLGSRLRSIELTEDRKAKGITLEDGTEIAGEIVILGLGVRPDNQLAKEAELELGSTGGIKVNDYLQSSDPDIFAVGDVIEVRNFVTGEPSLIALAGPANRQGRMAADNIFLKDKKRYRGTLGTAVVRTFSQVAACTGVNEKSLRRIGIPFEKAYLFPKSHAGYFPGAKELSIKILFSPSERKLLGAQVIGEDGAEKRIDVFATAILGGMSIDDITELELSYAPPVGSAKDPVNLAGMIMQNVADGLVGVVAPDADHQYILDVREPKEVEKLGAIPGSVNIPLTSLEERMNELPKNKVISVYCQSGQRSYGATRKLIQNGFQAQNISGAFKAFKLIRNMKHNK